MNTWISGIMCLGHGLEGYYFAIFGFNNIIYICDSHSQNKHGLPIVNGTSALVSFSTQEEVIQYL